MSHVRLTSAPAATGADPARHRALRCLLAAVATAVLLLVTGTGPPASAAGAGDDTSTREHWPWPLSPAPTVVAGFEAPSSDYGPGHRGIDLLAAAGQPVLSATEGEVTFAGAVAGRGVVVVRAAAGLRLTYEPVSPTVRVGDRVDPGRVLGLVQVAGSHCFPEVCLHVGLRRGSQYLDPRPHFGAARVRLKPLAGLVGDDPVMRGEASWAPSRSRPSSTRGDPDRPAESAASRLLAAGALGGAAALTLTLSGGRLRRSGARAP